MLPTGKQAIYRDNKRNRRPTSCEQCRVRKAKCNRELPCDACIKRGDRSLCKYAGNAIRNPKPKNNVGERLQRVENLVSELLEGGIINESSKKESNEPLGDNSALVFTKTTPNDEEATIQNETIQRGHLDSTHWLSILDDIKEVRQHLSQSEIYTPEENDIDNEQELDLVLGPTELSRIQDIIHSLPPRPICDKLLSQYFNSTFNLPIVHTVKFQNEYEKFWQDPTTAPPLWIGLLFSILGVAAAVLQAMGQGSKTGTHTTLSVKTFRTRTAECLVMGNYKNSSSYTLETLVLHLLGKYVGKPDSSFDSWFLMGNIIRLALRFGYHRDPKTQPNISPFDGEMRRRCWHAILQLDILLSFQMGMPSMIPEEFCDTEPPRNLNDSELSPNLETLPPPRPLSDWTPILYTIVKSKIMGMFRKIIAHTQSSMSFPSYPTTIELDGKLRETYAAIPDDFKMKPINQSFTISSGLIISRCTIELLFLKSIMVLHRRYLKTERLDPQWEFSRRACINAALEILTRQADLHEATQLDGRLYEDRWMVSSLTSHDFLLASMVVCLELSVLMRSSPAHSLHLPSSSLLSMNDSSIYIRRLLDALINSQRIWASRSVYSKEARTAALTLQLMIDNVQGKKQTPSVYMDTESHNTGSLHDVIDPTTVAALPDTSEAPDVSFAETMTDMIHGTENLDWALLDQYLLNPGSPTPQLNVTGDNWSLSVLDMEADASFYQSY
ncbi:fungal-specific transcription factor domain-containing protein [Talaromyces proteolyticus]|uniref:Fungal-specific transcription factor domain-containing protein n=1 Tax=Talaromyces proteolyticus TaxID=1131652 RepID=A0AAD4KMV7_9EURO|nr:fungal-specific transcription factor domain-containing protein [Talaromyces proteolyticus]KAH8692102.1 fungal-specific transcription factor domain-containing protein [Talaromyces proteolyticus]